MTALIAVALILSGDPASQTETARGLSVQYADGRRTVTPLSTQGRVSWTPIFPRIPGAVTDRDGLRLFAMQYEEALEPNGVAVTVALLYGSPYERRVPVDTVHVSAGRAARVDALEAFGIQPVTFALVPLPPVQLPLPSIISPSSDLEISVETVTEPVPVYHAIIANRSSRDVMMVAFKAYRGVSTPAVSGRPRGSGHTPLIPAGGTYVLKVSASTQAGRAAVPAQWLPLDRIEITSVLWSDNLVEGDGKAAADEHALDAGTALQLDRIVPLLRAAERDPAAHALTDLRASIASLTLVVTPDEVAAAGDAIPGTVRLPARTVSVTMADGMRNARSAVLNDIDELLRATPSPAPPDYAGWLARVAGKYAAWRARIRS